MNRVAIISNGPSAHLFDGARREDFDAVIGVNWTVSRWLCDWWCFCDWPTFVDTQPMNRPRLFVSRFALEKLPLNAPEHAERLKGYPQIVVHEEIALPPLLAPPRSHGPGGPEDLPKWNAFSGCAALGLAWHLRAKRVTVFGADMRGEYDHARRFGHSRTAERWRHERRIWDGLVVAFQQQAVRVERIVDHGPGPEGLS